MPNTQDQDHNNGWFKFLDFAKQHCSETAFGNWLAPIHILSSTAEEITLEVPNVFVQEYLLANYKKDLCAFLPLRKEGDPAINFVIAAPTRKAIRPPELEENKSSTSPLICEEESWQQVKLNDAYRFDNFISGPSSQFVKSAALGVARQPGSSFNPLFIHGGVGLGKTHILHSIGHYVREHNKRLRVQCITTEQFINELVDHLRNKSVDKLKKFYRSDIDILLVDDIQFLQNRQNFEEEFCNTFEALINQNKQIVITCDKPPSQLKLSDRMVGRMEWGLVAHVSVPELETRVAILQAKAEQKGLSIPDKVAFFIAEHIYSNVRQLEGAINRLSAHSRLLRQSITEEFVEQTLRQMMPAKPSQRISVEQILKAVSAVFQVSIADLRGSSRTKEVVLPRAVAMYLAREMISESLKMLGASFGGKSHSTILHACKNIEEKLHSDDMLRRQICMVRRSIQTAGAA